MSCLHTRIPNLINRYHTDFVLPVVFVVPATRMCVFWVISILYTSFCNIYTWLFLANVRQVQWVSLLKVWEGFSHRATCRTSFLYMVNRSRFEYFGVLKLCLMLEIGRVVRAGGCWWLAKRYCVDFVPGAAYLCTWVSMPNRSCLGSYLCETASR